VDDEQPGVLLEIQGASFTTRHAANEIVK